ncbi:hypothetical protein [Kribbella shirazensis]|uniref:Uncharacterized protein n=1 Tax=Kribbella shirazensis TaxID=1105143 RepID=A0A7X5VH01_9ACTN|nr:hypothetical protein [Kribbella shirazensis]NIK61074.1 hypothetical protein [Kribbella shirazensis]
MKTHAEPPLYDDPTSFYVTAPAVRVANWPRSIWRRHGTVDVDFSPLGTVTTFSWPFVDERDRALGHEMRAATPAIRSSLVLTAKAPL